MRKTGLAELLRGCEQRATRSLEAIKESDPWSALLTWTEVIPLASGSDVEIGSHTVDHARLGLADASTVRDELRRSKAEIEAQTGRPCRHLAYPNGSYNAEAVQIARQEGYACALTVDEGLNPPGQDLMMLQRIGVPPDVSSTELLARVSGLSVALARLKSRLVGE